MGVELELHSQRPERGRKRMTLLRASYAHGNALVPALGRFDPHGPRKLGWVDRYGDTFFNEQEAEAAQAEVVALLERCGDDAQKLALQDLGEMLSACAATPGSYLWFIGD